MTMVCMAAVSFGAQPDDSVVRVTIRMVNSARVPQATLLEGEKNAAYILEKAGVGLTWQDCLGGSTDGQSDPCGSALGAAEFWLHVAAWKPNQKVGNLLGFTLFRRDEENLAGVYYPLVRLIAANCRMDESVILGPVLAHEIGHLLGVGHNPTGVMCPAFKRSHIVQAGMGNLLFSAPEGGQIRTEVARRRTASEIK